MNILFIDNFDSFTILFKNTNTAEWEYYYGCVLESIDIDAGDVGEIVTLTLNFSVQTMGWFAAEQHGAGVYTAYPASETFLLGEDITLTKSGGFVTDEALDNVLDFSISIDQDVTKKWRLGGSEFPVGVHVGGSYKVEGSWSEDFGDEKGFLEVDYTADLDAAVLAIALGTLGTITLTQVTVQSDDVGSSVGDMMSFEMSFDADTVAFT